MPVLFVLNLVVACTLVLWPLWFSQRCLRLPALNPFTIALLVGLPVELMKLLGGPLVLLEEGLFDHGYQFAVLASNALLLSQVAGLVFFFRVSGVLRVETWLPWQQITLTSADMRRGSRVFLLLYGVAFYLLASSEFGVFNWIATLK